MCLTRQDIYANIDLVMDRMHNHIIGEDSCPDEGIEAPGFFQELQVRIQVRGCSLLVFRRLCLVVTIEHFIPKSLVWCCF